MLKKIFNAVLFVLALLVITIGIPVMVMFPEIALYVVGAAGLILIFVFLDNVFEAKRDKLYGSRFIRRP